MTHGHGSHPWYNQWEFQDPKMEVLYHIRPYFMGMFPYIGLKNRPYRYLQFRILKIPLIQLCTTFNASKYWAGKYCLFLVVWHHLPFFVHFVTVWYRLPFLGKGWLREEALRKLHLNIRICSCTNWYFRLPPGMFSLARPAIWTYGIQITQIYIQIYGWNWCCKLSLGPCGLSPPSTYLNVVTVRLSVTSLGERLRS